MNFDDDIDYDYDDMEDHHGIDCDCEECTYENAMDECSYLPEHGGCLSAGSEFCDWECPLRRQLERDEASE